MEALSLRLPGGRPVLEKVSWSLPPGSKLMVKGQAAHEVTAFLQLCAGLLHPQSGRVRLGGEVLAPYRLSHPFLERGALAWVPAGGGLLANQSLLANVSLPLRFVRGLPRAIAEARAMEWLERAGLDPLAGHRPHAMTPQERWMGALARSGASGAELWLVDPPQGGLSPAMRRKAWEILGPVLESPGGTALLAEDGPWLMDPPRHWLHLENGTLTSGSAP